MGIEGFLKLNIMTKSKMAPSLNRKKKDFEAPGPFSLVSHLKAMLKGDFYGDEITLIVISMMWQVRVTVLNGETLHQIKIRHGNRLGKADLAVAHCPGITTFHYVSAL